MGTKTTRPVAVAAFAISGLLVAACSGPSGAEPGPTSETQNPNGLKNFDACTVLRPNELEAQGLAAKGEPHDQGIGEVGCEFKGEDFILKLLKGEDSDRAYFAERRDNFAEYEENQVGTHQGLRSIAKSFEGLGVCEQRIFAGGGSVVAQIGYDSDQKAGKDPCAKAMEFAEMIEPRLPE